MIDKALGYRLAGSEKPLNRDVDSFEGGYEGTADERSSPFGRVRHAAPPADAHGSEVADTHLQSSGDDAADHSQGEAGGVLGRAARGTVRHVPATFKRDRF